MNNRKVSYVKLIVCFFCITSLLLQIAMAYDGLGDFSSDWPENARGYVLIFDILAFPIGLIIDFYLFRFIISAVGCADFIAYPSACGLNIYNGVHIVGYCLQIVFIWKLLFPRQLRRE